MRARCGGFAASNAPRVCPRACSAWWAIDGRASSALFFGRRGHAGVPFSFPQKGNGAPGGARGLRGPFGLPLRSGSPRADCRGRDCEARPRARAPRMRQVCEACRPGAAPPGAPFGPGHTRPGRGTQDVSPRTAPPPALPRLETGKDWRLISATYSYEGFMSIGVCGPRGFLRTTGDVSDTPRPPAPCRGRPSRTTPCTSGSPAAGTACR